MAYTLHKARSVYWLNQTRRQEPSDQPVYLPDRDDYFWRMPTVTIPDSRKLIADDGASAGVNPIQAFYENRERAAMARFVTMQLPKALYDELMAGMAVPLAPMFTADILGMLCGQSERTDEPEPTPQPIELKLPKPMHINVEHVCGIVMRQKVVEIVLTCVVLAGWTWFCYTRSRRWR